MQYYFSSARQDVKALFARVYLDARLYRNPCEFASSAITRVGLTSLHLQRNHNRDVFLCEVLNNRSGLHFNPMRVGPVNACSSSSCDDVHKEREHTRKVNWTTLSIALTMGIALLADVGAAVASSHLAIHSSIGTRGGRELLPSAWMGLMAGCLHTLTGPDHLAALAPLSVGRTKLESVAVGALWGCGHDAGQVIFGILFLLLKDKLQIEVLRTWGARVVGMTLVAIGITGIKEAQEAAVVPCLAGNSGTLASNSLSRMEPLNGARKNVSFTTFVTGIVHGLQPDALIMILPALALPSRFAGAAFLSMFLVGTVLSMSSYTAFIGSCSNALQKNVPRITEYLSWGSSLLAILVGVGVLAGELFGLSIL